MGNGSILAKTFSVNVEEGTLVLVGFVALENKDVADLEGIQVDAGVNPFDRVDRDLGVHRVAEKEVGSVEVRPAWEYDAGDWFLVLDRRPRKREVFPPTFSDDFGQLGSIVDKHVQDGLHEDVLELDREPVGRRSRRVETDVTATTDARRLGRVWNNLTTTTCAHGTVVLVVVFASLVVFA